MRRRRGPSSRAVGELSRADVRFDRRKPVAAEVGKQRERAAKIGGKASRVADHVVRDPSVGVVQVIEPGTQRAQGCDNQTLHEFMTRIAFESLKPEARGL